MKAVGCVLILVCAYIYGVYRSRSIKNECEMCRTLYSSMLYCTSQIEKRTPSDVIYKRLGEAYPHIFASGMTLNTVSKIISERIGGECGAVGAEFFSSVGSRSVNEQLGELEYLCEKMKLFCDKKKDKCEKDARICRLIPLFFAALAVIIFI